ncbi:hypothetical protein MG293_000250 [Ovis ammon polii]|uniref:Uncharacterized protein n=1 Tax=Ovis ammon polii TaxID=230172 RepID=A0AAD4UPJ3_OVIAM|nr:hypothetical protein MG293_000250 [Ovis ammon polii]
MTWKLTEEMVGASLVVQWIRIRLAVEGTPYSILGSWKIPHTAAPELPSLRSRAPQVATTETMRCNYEPAYPRACLCKKRNRCNEKPMHCNYFNQDPGHLYYTVNISVLLICSYGTVFLSFVTLP